ncbi:MAG: hypothetical protein JSS79_01090 [Bacteroidetes bacterium]|nr:hypothetical protein [Bacteroidota bacterium]
MARRSFWLICFVLGGLTSYGQTLTLKERQAIANLDFSWSEKRILENYGSAVKIELDQTSVAGDMDAILYADSRGAQTAANAIARVCGDNLGKDALRGKKITKVVIKNIREGKPKVEIKDGTLSLFTGLSSSENYFGESDLQAAIENLL